MSETKPPLTIDLVWRDELLFEGRSGDATLRLDSAGQAGVSPVQALGFALAACMSIDVVHILKKGRAELRGLRSRLVAERAESEPRRLLSARLHFVVEGAIEPERIERAIALSREKYCSVWHSLRQDIDFATSYEQIRS